MSDEIEKKTKTDFMIFFFFQIKKWLTLAENVKTLASIKTLDCSKNVKSGMEVMGIYFFVAISVFFVLRVSCSSLFIVLLFFRQKLLSSVI